MLQKNSLIILSIMIYTCSFCSNKNNFIVCDSCGSLNDSSIKDYFGMYQTNGIMDLKIENIESVYYNLASKIHPDLFQQKDDKQKELSLRYSELINNGLPILKDIFKRANYFCDLYKLREKSDSIPKEIMLDIFNVQELLESKYHSEEERQKLKKFLKHFSSMREDLKKKLEKLFHSYDEKRLKAVDIEDELNDILNHSSYINRLIVNIEMKLNE